MRRLALIISFAISTLTLKAQHERLDSLLNTSAPNFELTTRDSLTFKLSELKGKTVVLNFWFMACAPCVRELPELNKVVEKYAGKEVIFLAISVQDSADNLRIFLKRKPFGYKIVSKNKELTNLLGITFYPTNIVIDKTGKIIFAKSGYDENIAEMLGEAIDKTLKEE